MSLESIDSESVYPAYFAEWVSDLEETRGAYWQGHEVTHAQIGQGVDQVRTAVLSNRSDPQPDFMLCGDKFDGKAKIALGADRRGNKEASIEIEGRSKDNKVSTAVKGSLSQNEQGKVNGGITLETEAHF